MSGLDRVAENPRREEIRRLLQQAEDLQDQPALAMQACQQALNLAEESGQGFAVQVADCLRQRGVVFYFLSNYDAALRDFSQAQILYDVHRQPRGIAILHNLTAVIYTMMGLYPEALQSFLTAYEYFTETDEMNWKIELLNNLGYTYLLMEQAGQGLPYLHESLRLLSENEVVKVLSPTLDSLAQAYLQIGNLELALGYSQKSIQASHRRGSTLELIESKNTAAQVYAAQGDAAQAQTLLAESIAMAQEAGFQRSEAEGLKIAGDVFLSLNRCDEALSSYQRALEIAQHINLQPMIYACFRKLSEVCKRNGDLQCALEFFEHLVDMTEDISSYHARMRLSILATARDVDHARRENFQMHEANSRLSEEVHKHKQAQQAAEYLAITDALTGIYNRRHFFELAQVQLSRSARSHRPLSILMLDIDHFKQVNDTYGHLTGDRILVLVAETIRASLREGDLVGRYGGEEFVIMLDDANVEQARQAAERLRESVMTQSAQTERGAVEVTISIGISEVRFQHAAGAINLDQTLSQADDALYEAKRGGRNRVAVYPG